jgi:hypothetical protein
MSALGQMPTLASYRPQASYAVCLGTNRRRAVGPHRGIAGKTRGDLRDACHVDGMGIAPGQQGLTRGRAKCSGVEAGIGQTTLCELLRNRHVARAAIGTRCAKAHVIEQDDNHVRSPLRGTQWVDDRRSRIARVEC